MKSHKTVTMTADMLRDLSPCGWGMDAAKPLLPAKISTDPLENLDLAERLVQETLNENEARGFNGASSKMALSFAEWLAGNESYYKKTDDNEHVSVYTGAMPDIDLEFHIAQLLAWWADSYLTERGQ